MVVVVLVVVSVVVELELFMLELLVDWSLRADPGPIEDVVDTAIRIFAGLALLPEDPWTM